MMSDIEKPDIAPGQHVPRSIESDEVEHQLDSVDPKLEAKLVRKLDLFIIPVVMLLYLLSFLDRFVYTKSQFLSNVAKYTNEDAVELTSATPACMASKKTSTCPRRNSKLPSQSSS